MKFQYFTDNMLHNIFPKKQLNQWHLPILAPQHYKQGQLHVYISQLLAL